MKVVICKQWSGNAHISLQGCRAIGLRHPLSATLITTHSTWHVLHSGQLDCTSWTTVSQSGITLIHVLVTRFRTDSTVFIGWVAYPNIHHKQSFCWIWNALDDHLSHVLEDICTVLHKRCVVWRKQFQVVDTHTVTYLYFPRSLLVRMDTFSPLLWSE